MVTRCRYCGRYFVPDRRAKEKQKACSDPECRRKRKKAAQEAWLRKNPGYFRGRYPYVKAWRKERRVIQDEIPPAKRSRRLIFIIPADMVPMIQDEIVMKRSGKRTFTGHGHRRA